MKCKYFGKCGSCNLYEYDYEGQLKIKIEENGFFKDLGIENIDIIKSKDSHFRARAEFRIFHKNDDISYAMHSMKDKNLLPIDECPITLKPIFNLMPKLLKEIKKTKILKYKLFTVEFLSSLNEDTLVTLIYHKPLDEKWEKEAKILEEMFGISVIGRSRGVKIVLSKDYIFEKIKIFDKVYTYMQIEGCFTQPNPYVNQKMIEWVLKNSKDFEGDLLELYCGIGNFTIPLSKNFKNVLATEVSKSSIKAAKENVKLNNIKNIKFARLSAKESFEALNNIREFRRLKQEDIDLKDYNFSTIFIDPPRCGLDDMTRDFVKEFENIIYISCNPKTLYRDLKYILPTHNIKKFAFFDQFPYTKHLESGAILIKK